jgi:hypothetical protein
MAAAPRGDARVRRVPAWGLVLMTQIASLALAMTALPAACCFLLPVSCFLLPASCAMVLGEKVRFS